MNSNDLKYRLTLLAATLEATTDGILVVDHHTRRIHQFNQRFLKLWNIPHALAERRDDNELINFVLNQLENPEQFVNLVNELYQNPLQESFDRLNFKDGRAFDRHSRAIIIDDTPKGRVWYFRDITEQLHLQKQLEEQRLKTTHSSRMAALGEMAAGIAHEINNPLSIIVARTWQLKVLIKKTPIEIENVAAALNIIENTAEKIAGIIKGMRSISRDAETDPFIPQDLNSIIQETLIFCRERFKVNDVDLVTEIPSKGITISCHPSQISQILLNLLNNAFDAVTTLPEKWVSLQVKEEERHVKIMVTDSGHGIPDELKTKLAQPFFTTKPLGKGTGLGLSISLVIADAHHGEIYLDTNCKNTRFVLKLPKI